MKNVTGGRLKAPSTRARRFPMGVALSYRTNGMSHWHEGRTVNISRTGILFECDEDVSPPYVLDIRIHLPWSVIVTCQGTVVRQVESSFAVRIHRYRISHE